MLPWVYGIATNICRNHHRSGLRHDSAMRRLVDVTERRGDHDEDIADRIDDQRRLRNVLDRVRELPQGDQDVFVLICWEELSYAAAATALQIPIGTVRSRLARVRRVLRLSDSTPREQRETFDV
ncbi:MAG: sigma-70 family RNA polymerase sigma factor [Microlunatus sp.]